MSTTQGTRRRRSNIYQTLPTLKSGILKSLDSAIYLSPLHNKLATKARSLKSLASLYGYHPSKDLSCSTKEKLAIILTSWYSEYRDNHHCEDIAQIRIDSDYPLAVLLPVVIQLIFQKEVEEEIIIDATPTLEEFDNDAEDPHLSITFPKWEGEYNHILQLNTCSQDNILAVISLHKNNIVKSLNLIGKIPSETKFNHHYNLATNNQFDELQDFIAGQIEMDLFIDETGLVKTTIFSAQKARLFNFSAPRAYAMISMFPTSNVTNAPTPSLPPVC